jgi:hypothetical protein
MSNFDVSAVLDAIDIGVSKAVSEAGYDKTFVATIVGDENKEQGVYRVKYQLSSFNAVNYTSNQYYDVGDLVYVTIPSNDSNLDKQIIGKVSQSVVDAATDIYGSELDKYSSLGNLYYAIDNENDLSCKLTNSENSIKLKPIKKTDYENLTMEDLHSGLMASPYFVVEMDVKTNIAAGSTSNYGLRFDFIISGRKTAKTYTFDINKMIGQPYDFTAVSHQYAIFKIENADNFESIDKVTAFCEGFEEDDSVILSNIVCYAATESGKQLKDYSLKVDTKTNINYLYNDNSRVTLQAQMYIGDAAFSSDQIKYYWFREDLTIDSTKQDKYLLLNGAGGEGWACLNNRVDLEAINDNVSVTEWEAAASEFVLKNDDDIAPIYKNVYKCVAVYKGGILISNEIEIINYKRTNYNIELTSTVRTYKDLLNNTDLILNNADEKTGDFVYSQESTALQETDRGLIRCSVAGYTPSTYLWFIKDSENKLSIFEDNVTHEVTDNYRFIYGNDIYDYVTIKCGICDADGKYLGKGELILTNIDQDMKIRLLSKENAFNALTNNGAYQGIYYGVYGDDNAIQQIDASNIESYEKDKVKLFINAEYIKSGHLEVSNSEEIITYEFSNETGIKNEYKKVKITSKTKVDEDNNPIVIFDNTAFADKDNPYRIVNKDIFIEVYKTENNKETLYNIYHKTNTLFYVDIDNPTNTQIGGFKVTDNALYNGKQELNSTNAGVYIGTNGISVGKDDKNYFTVTADGKIYISNYATSDSVNNSISSVKESLEARIGKLDQSTQDKLIELNDTLTNAESNLQKQIDGTIDTFSGNVIPEPLKTINRDEEGNITVTITNNENYPYTDWYIKDKDGNITADVRERHLGDVFIVNSDNTEYSGFMYRFEWDEDKKQYYWVLISDSQITSILGDIQSVTSDLDNLDSNIFLTKKVDGKDVKYVKLFDTSTKTVVDELDSYSRTFTEVIGEGYYELDEDGKPKVDENGNKIRASITSKLSNVSQTVDEIKSYVGETVEGDDGNIITLSTQIKQTKDSLSAYAKQDSGEDKSEFGYTLTPINFTLYSNNNTVMRVDKDGLSIEGYVKATSGEIGGCSISDGKLIVKSANIESINADKILIGDFSNYCQLTPSSAETFGWTYNNDGWYTRVKLDRDNYPGNYLSIKDGDEFYVSCIVSSNVTLNGSYQRIGIGIHYINDEGTQNWPVVYITSNLSASEQEISTSISIPSNFNATKMQAFVQIENDHGANYQGTLKIKDFRIIRKSTGNLIVNGSITADNIKTGAITLDKITGTGNLSISTDGTLTIDSSYFTLDENGSITATSGSIGGLIISDSGLSASNVLIITKSGQISAKNIQIEGDFLAGSLKIASISGRYSGSASFNFESSGVQTETVTVTSKTYNVTDAGADGFLGIGFKAGSVTLTITLNKALLYSTIFTITPRYQKSGYSAWSGTETSITISAGGTTGTATVANKVKDSFTDPCTFVGFLCSPESFTQDTTTATQAIQCTGSILPATAALALGTSAVPWNHIYSNNSVESSDKKIKTDICDLSDDFCLYLINNLSPKSYKFNNATTPRTKYGFIAQEVEQLLNNIGMTTNDCGLVCKSKPDEPDGEDNHYGLNYLNLIAPIVKVIQNLNIKTQELEEEIEQLKKNL